ncbi:MAG: hypothetical protein ABI743_10145 [bacterium]
MADKQAPKLIDNEIAPAKPDETIKPNTTEVANEEGDGDDPQSPQSYEADIADKEDEPTRP